MTALNAACQQGTTLTLHLTDITDEHTWVLNRDASLWQPEGVE